MIFYELQTHEIKMQHSSINYDLLELKTIAYFLYITVLHYIHCISDITI